jgi:SAM-dependent methyltransferase
MRPLTYLKYFFFVGSNWNFKLAFFTLFHEIKGENKYKVDTIEIDRLRNAEIKSENLAHSSIYQGVGYYSLEKAFDYLQTLNVNQNIVDFGCGKGRVLAVAAHYGFQKIIGVDFAPALCKDALKNIEHIKPYYPGTNFKVVCDDVVDYKIDNDTNVFFFFNPFDEVVMLQVVKNILNSLKQNFRKIYIVYVNPLHKEIFESAGLEEEYYMRKMEYIEVSILSNEVEEN